MKPKNVILFAVMLFSLLQAGRVSCQSISLTSPLNFTTEISKFGLLDRDTLVDIGAGDGVFDAQISYFLPNMYFILEDTNPKSEKYISRFYKQKANLTANIKKKYITVLGSNDSIPLETEKYKTVLCRKSFHEFANLPAMMKELYRILRPGGTLIIEEVEPISEKELDKYCKMQYLSKQYVVEKMQHTNFTLINSDEVLLPKNRKFYILLFRK
jgi:ubiquinone/menaquinone biosynthesis C-methylase UbiE